MTSLIFKAIFSPQRDGLLSTNHENSCISEPNLTIDIFYCYLAIGDL